MLLHNYLDSDNYTAGLVKDNLATISDSEINNIKKRINFYVNHFKISTKNSNSEAKARQLEFLLNVNTVLDSELESRQVTVERVYAYNVYLS